MVLLVWIIFCYKLIDEIIYIGYALGKGRFIRMKKDEYLEKLDELGLDKSKYCIIAGGVMLMYGLEKK